jgi:uncharacterized membrane protein YhaH (DUF805 family)
MEPFALFFSASGRIAWKPFALGVVLVYGLSFFSQALLSPPVMARSSVAPFAIFQLLLTWCWFVLHAKRRRDADRGIGGAIAIAILYLLVVILLMLLIVPLSGPSTSGGTPEGSGANLASFFVVLMLFAALTGQMNLDFFFYLALAVLFVTLTPILIALAFSIRVGMRPSARPVP